MVSNWIAKDELQTPGGFNRPSTDVVFVEEKNKCDISFPGRGLWKSIKGPALVVGNVFPSSWTEGNTIHLKMGCCRQILDGAPMEALEQMLRESKEFGDEYAFLNEGVRKHFRKTMEAAPQLPHSVKEMEAAPDGAWFRFSGKGGMRPILPPGWIFVIPHKMSGVSGVVIRTSDRRVKRKEET